MDYSNSNAFVLSNNSSLGTNDRVVITTGGSVGIGTSSPSYRLDIQSGSDFDVRLRDTSLGGTVGIVFETANDFSGTSQSYIKGIGAGNSGVSQLIFGTAGASGDTAATERMRITSAGYVGIGTTSPTGSGSPSNLLHLAGSTAVLRVGPYFTTSDRDFIELQADGANTKVYSPNEDFSFYNPIGNANITGSVINICSVGNTNFFNNGSEKMRIVSGGEVLMHSTSFNSANAGQLFGTGGDTYFTTDTSIVLYVNRKGNDGTLVDLRQDNATEGTISVSGSTVSYNGGHLARYTQTESNQRIEGLLKGTVMSNLDKMAEWINPETEQPYENEQLNCMKISDVEGDINVAGVFVNWDNDDEEFTNDMNIAMTGDMIIRIAQNLVVQKGQLLMSAGDGTAKPQEDDIIRSKTIAKVTSNHITCVYEDGSYCVPCVLMAC